MKTESFKTTVAKLYYYGDKIIDGTIFHGGKLFGRIIFPFLLIKNHKQTITQTSYFPECELKSKFQIFIEQFFYIIRYGEANQEYFIQGFDRKSKNDFSNYVPWLAFAHTRDNKNQQPSKPTYDPFNFVCLLRDKFIFEAFCKGIGIQTPTNIGMINSGKIFLIKENKFISIKDITDYEFDAFCKRNIGYGGGMAADILKLAIKSKKIYINEKEISSDELTTLLGNDIWIIQERIKNQNNNLSQLHPSSINTTRVVTINTGKEISILFAVLRIGTNGRHTDNWSSGGIVVGVNIETGVLEKWGFQSPKFGTKCDRHPNSGLRFEKQKIPFWNDIIEYVKKAHSLFYGLHSIGWDVAVTEEGVMIIEGNDNWGTSLSQLYKGMNKEYEQYFK